MKRRKKLGWWRAPIIYCWICTAFFGLEAVQWSIKIEIGNAIANVVAMFLHYGAALLLMQWLRRHGY